MTNEQIEELMREISSTPLLTKEEELELLEKIQAKGVDCDEMRKMEKGEHAVCGKLSDSMSESGSRVGGID